MMFRNCIEGIAVQRLFSLVCCANCILFCGGIATGSEQSAKNLPEGAVARFGSSVCRSHIMAYATAHGILAIGGNDGLVQFIDPSNGRDCRRRLKVNDSRSPVGALSLSPDGLVMATGTIKSLRLWDLKNDEPRNDIKLNFDLLSLAFSPDGRILAAAGTGRQVILWSVASGLVTARLGSHKDSIRAVRFSPDGKRIASGGDDGVVLISDSSEGKILHRIDNADKAVRCIAFAPHDPNLIAFGGMDGVIHIWDLRTDREIKTLSGHGSWIASIDFTPDGSYLVSGSGYSSTPLIMWKVGTGKLEGRFPTLPQAVSGVFISRDGKKMVSGGDNVRVWDLETRQELLKKDGHEGAIDSLAFSQDGSTLITLSSGDCTIRYWDAPSGKQRRLLGPVDGMGSCLALSPDARLIAFACCVDEGKPGIALHENGTGDFLRFLQGETGSCTSIAFASDASIVAAACGNSIVKVWTVKGKRNAWSFTVDELTGFDGHVGLCFVDEGQSMAVRGARWLAFWDAKNRKKTVSIAENLERPGRSTLTSQGQFIASPERDGFVGVWSTANRRMPRRVLCYPSLTYGSTAISADGKLLASVHVEATRNCISVWEIATGTLVGQFAEDAAADIRTLAFSPDLRVLASNSVGNSAISWNLKSLALTRKTDATMDELWIDLGQGKGAIGYAAIYAFLPKASFAVDFFREKSSRMPKVDTKEYTQRLAALDSDVFAEREKAERELFEVAEIMEPLLLIAREKTDSIEVKSRIDRVLKKRAGRASGREILRFTRMIMILERMQSSAAVEFLERIGTGGFGVLSDEAEAVLERMRKNRLFQQEGRK